MAKLACYKSVAMLVMLCSISYEHTCSSKPAQVANMSRI